jgi:tetratricopeptide (TPR) repeat protein
VAIETGDPLGTILTSCLRDSPNPALSTKLHRLIPEHTTALQELAIVVTEQSIAHLSRRGGSRQQRAIMMNNLAGRLLAAGQAGRAAATAEMAVTLYREETDEGVGSLRPGLAISLNTLSAARAAAGQTAKALEPARESVALRRHPTDNESSGAILFGQSLNTLANRLMAQGEWRESLAAAEEAVEICAGLPGTTFSLGELARAYDTLSYAQLNCGLDDKAVETSRRAQALYRHLAEIEPDAFVHLLAVSCSNLAGILLRGGNPVAAEAAGRDAVESFSRLAASRADAFLEPFLRALISYGQSLCALHRYGEAQESLNQAMEMLKALQVLGPTHRLIMAQAQDGLALTLAGQERFTEAIAAGERAVAEYTNLSLQDHGGTLPDLARCSTNLASFHLEAGEPSRSLQALEEARGVYSLLRKDAPDLFAEGLTGVLRSIAEVSMLDGDRRRAFRALWEMMELLEPKRLQSTIRGDVLAEFERRFIARIPSDCTEILSLLEVLRACIDESGKER